MKNRIKFIYFDVGGVLLYWQDVLKDMAKRFDKTVIEIEKFYYKYDEISCRGKIKPSQLWRKMQKELDLPGDIDFDYELETMRSFYPIKITHEFVKKLNKRIPVGLLTNVHTGIYDLCIKHGHIPNLNYKVVVQSCEIGLVKPDKEIYLYAQKLAQVAPDQIFFTDDSQENVEAARALGWNALVFDPKNPKKSIREIEEMIGID